MKSAHDTYIHPVGPSHLLEKPEQMLVHQVGNGPKTAEGAKVPIEVQYVRPRRGSMYQLKRSGLEYLTDLETHHTTGDWSGDLTFQFGLVERGVTT